MAIVKSPRASLSDAIERVRKIYQAEGTRPFDDGVAVKHMGYGGLSGASRTMLGAVRGYGLLTGRSPNMSVSHDAVVILADEKAEDQSERTEALIRSLRHNRVFDELYERFGNDSSELSIASYLQKTHQMNPNSAAKTAKSYKDSAEVVFANSQGYDEETHDDVQVTAEDFNREIDIQKQPQRPPLGANMRQETFTLTSSEVLIQFPDQMSREDFEDFRDWLTILERKVGRTVIKDEDPDSSQLQ